MVSPNGESLYCVFEDLKEFLPSHFKRRKLLLYEWQMDIVSPNKINKLVCCFVPHIHYEIHIIYYLLKSGFFKIIFII